MNKHKRFEVIDDIIPNDIILQKFEWQIYLMIRFNNSVEAIINKLNISNEDLEGTCTKLINSSLIRELVFSFSDFQKKFYPNLELKNSQKTQLTMKEITKLVEQKVGTGKNANITLYRIFLSIPSDLLRSEGVQSFSNISEDFTFTRQDVIKQIQKSLYKILGTALIP